MTKEELKKRTTQFALDVIRFVDRFPHARAVNIIGQQLIKAAMSVGANYRCACRAQSHAHFVCKYCKEKKMKSKIFNLES